MEDAKLRFSQNWNKLFPNSEIPDLSFFESKDHVEKEFARSQNNLQYLRNEIGKEEFISNFLLKVKNTIQDRSRELLSVSEEFTDSKIEILDTKSDNNSTSSFTSFKSFGTPSQQSINEEKESERISLPPTLPRHFSLPAVESEKLLNSHNKSRSVDETQQNKNEHNKRLQRRSTGPPGETNSLKVEPARRGFHSIPRNAKLLPHQDQFIDEPSPPTHRKLPSLPKNPSISSSSSDEDHIYTDISQLVLNKPPEIEERKPPTRIYENSHMQPKIDTLALSDSEENQNNLSERSGERLVKRHGSEDRKAFVFSDELEITNESGELVCAEQDDQEVFVPPEIIIDGGERNLQNEEEDEIDPYEEDEHIYANVNILKVHKKSDDSGSDTEAAKNDNNIYREMTSEDYATLKKRTAESDEDFSQSQDDDSDDSRQTPPVTKRRVSRSKRAQSSAVVNQLKELDSPDTKKRACSSPVRFKEGIEFPKVDSVEDVSVETEEELELVKAARMRSRLVMDLFENEKLYFDCLNLLMKFMKPLLLSITSSQPILTAADFRAIFHDTDKLHQMHKLFLNALESRIGTWDDQKTIGDLFPILVNGFSIYSKYIANYKTALETIAKCRSANQQFKAIVDQDFSSFSSLKGPRWKVEGLLYKPIDRITRYSLILNDLLKYTPPEHPDHPLITEASGALFELLEQVNVDTSKKKRRQRQLLKEISIVEVEEGHRYARSLILFNDVIISAKLKPSRESYVCKWYAALADINLKPWITSEAPSPIPVSAKSECDKLRASIANLRAEMRRDHMPLQNIVSAGDGSANPFVKKRNIHSSVSSRASGRGIEKIKKKIAEQERILQLIVPNVPLHIYHKNGKVYTFLFNMETEHQTWVEALKPRLKRIHDRKAESIHMSSLELQQAFETVLKVQRLGSTFSSIPSPLITAGHGRPMSVDFSKFDDKDALTGYLYVNILNGKGFNKNYDTYIVLELDSYGHFFKKSKTKPVKGTEPTWEEAFEHEIEVCTELRLTCYSKFRLKDDVCGKCTINLTRESLLDNKNHSLNVSLDRGQANLNVSLCFATSAEQIEKAKARRETGVFGAPINVVCSREKSVLPALVVSCIKEIEKRGMDEVGIYRLSGVASEIQNLKKLFNEDTQNAVVALHETDIHAVAGLLKLYFRELPECLFTGKLYTKFVEGLKISEAEEKELYMLDVLHELPRVNKLTALYLFEHLRRVAVREEQNKMGINNLATVFGPTCLRTPPPSSHGSGGQHSISCTVGTFDIGALDVMSQVRIFLFFLALSNSPRSCLPQDDLELWRRLDMDRALELEEVMMEKAEEHLI